MFDANRAAVLALRLLCLMMAGTVLVVVLATVIATILDAPTWWWVWRRLTVYAVSTFKSELPWVLSLLIVAFGLWLLQRPLARLLVPRAGRICPECGYDLRALKSGRCPECGWEPPRQAPMKP